jgi:peptidoglycan/LPS O-acetylase OafA/YrhL
MRGGMKYRSDIDGLRAIAILPVVAYHAGIALVPGGFVGVDVFFVISGYLICRLINDEIGDGSFTVAAFYKRRVMRLFPALFAMLLATSVLAYIYLLPIELKEFSDSMIAAVTYVSNVFFALTTGYFDAPAETKPLLHTWSLSVEEQFYIVCPLFMMACYRFCPKRLNALIAAGALLSFAAACLAYTRNPTFAFFLAPFRAWELLLGALLGIRFFPVSTSSDLKSIIGGSGLALVLFAVFKFSADTPLPLATAVACIGTALIIHSSENGASIVGRMLSWRPAVFVGMISYSLYLWHWPIMVFQRSDGILFAQATLTEKLGLIAISIGVAALSWKFIETPFRIRNKTVSVRLALGGAFASMAVVGALGAAAIALDGAPFRFPQPVVAIGSYLGYDPAVAFREGRCYLGANRQSFDTKTCLTKDDTKPNYLLIGDSHAAQLWLGLSSVLPGVNLMQATMTMCRPVRADAGAFDTRKCPQLMNFIFDDYLVHEKVDKVLLAAAWKPEDLPKLAATLDYLKERNIETVVFGPIVEYDYALPRLLADAIRYHDPQLVDRERSAAVPVIDRQMRALVTGKGVTYISTYDEMCRNGTCDKLVAGNIPFQFDAGHLTAAGSIALAEKLRDDEALP